ncbi:MAG: AMP-binding protein, partial [Rhodobacterales bacterium]|nr:AMP-binding protein [Rhodobacterales bacterium]
LNRKLRPPQIDRIMADTGAPLLVLDGPGLMGLRAELGTDRPMAQAPWHILRDGAFSAIHEKTTARLAEDHALSILDLADPALPETPGPMARPDGLPAGCCLFTSGSTGMPKGVLIAADDLLARADAEIDWFGLSADDVLLSILPFSFDVGLNQLCSALRVGARLVLLDSWLPADILNAVAEHGVTGISAVPSIWRDMIGAGMGFDPAGPHATLRYVTVSGGSLSPRHLRDLRAITPGIGIIKTYGQTEAFRAACLLPHEIDAHGDSVGRAFGGVRLYVIDDDGNPCPPGTGGQVVHTGLGTMLGYLGGGPEGKRVPNPFHGADDPAEVAILTGDFGTLDADGYLTLKGRKDAMLKVAGNRIYPDEITHEITNLDAVAEAELVDVTDADGDTVLAVFVVPRAGADLTPLALRRALGGRLPSYMVPQEVVVLDAMPRTASGKPDRPALKADAQKRLAAGAET